MKGDNTRLRIENEMFGRREKKEKEMDAKNILPAIREARENPVTVSRD